MLLAVIAQWLAELVDDAREDDTARLVAEALREIIGERRADAGVARPERRKN